MEPWNINPQNSQRLLEQPRTGPANNWTPSVPSESWTLLGRGAKFDVEPPGVSVVDGNFGGGNAVVVRAALRAGAAEPEEVGTAEQRTARRGQQRAHHGGGFA